MSDQSKQGAYYGKVPKSLWTDPWFRKLGLVDKTIFIYLQTGPAMHMTGLYHLPLVTIADTLDLTTEEVEQSIHGLLAHHVEYDSETREVFVRNCGEVQAAPDLAEKDNLIKHVERHLGGIHSKSLLQAFLNTYGERWNLSIEGASDRGLGEGVPQAISISNALAPTEHEQEQQQQHQTGADLIDFTKERQRRAFREGIGEDPEYLEEVRVAAKSIARPGREAHFNEKILEGGSAALRAVVGLRSRVDRGQTSFKRGERFNSWSVFESNEHNLQGECESEFNRMEAQRPALAASST